MQEDKKTPDKMVAGVSLWKEAWRRLKKNKLAVICLIIILTVFSICSIYAIPNLASLKVDDESLDLKITEVEAKSAAAGAVLINQSTQNQTQQSATSGLQVGDYLLKYNGEDIVGYRELDRLIEDVLKTNVENKKLGKPELTQVIVEVKRLTAKSMVLLKINPDTKKSELKSSNLEFTVPVGDLGLETNEPPVFFQEFRKTDGDRKNEGPSADHWFGTDTVGRDLFSRTLFGGFISFIIGVLATLVASFIGVLYGSISGYFGGKVDGFMMRFVDILYGLPFLMIIILIKVIADDLKNLQAGGEIIAGIITTIFVIIVAGLLIGFMFTIAYRRGVHSATGIFQFPRSLFFIIIVFSAAWVIVELIQTKIEFDTSSEWFGFMITFVIIGMYAWLTMARIARGQMLEIRSQDYITAARALGAKPSRIIFKHSIPNILGPVIIYATINIPAVILLEAFLSFLGLGISEPYCSWGSLAKEGFNTLSPVAFNWWMIVFPGGIMAISLFALNFLGDGIRDAIDPKMR